MAVAFLQGCANPAGRHRAGPIDHGGNRAGLDSARAQQIGIAAAPFAESEIFARHHARRADVLAEHGFGPFFRRLARHVAVEMEHQHGICARRREHFLPLI